jgi:hypothetical protein
MFSLTLLQNIKEKTNKVMYYLNNTNISAAVSEMENVGALVAQYSQKRADEIYNAIDKTWDVVCHVENRVPSEYEKFKKTVKMLYIGVLGDYLRQSDVNFKAMAESSASVLEYAKRGSDYAFTLAGGLSALMRPFSYKLAEDYKHYVDTIKKYPTKFKDLIEFTQNICGETMRIAIDDLNSKI